MQIDDTEKRLRAAALDIASKMARIAELETENEALRREVSELRATRRSYHEILGDQRKGVMFSQRLK